MARKREYENGQAGEKSFCEMHQFDVSWRRGRCFRRNVAPYDDSDEVNDGEQGYQTGISQRIELAEEGDGHDYRGH